MIHLRPDSTAYARTVETPAAPGTGGFTTPDNTVLEGVNPSALVEAMKKPTASVTDSFKATLSESIGAKALRGVEYSGIPSETGFDVSTALGDSVSNYTSDELEFLSDSRSRAELAQRQTQVQTTRDNYDAMGQNMLTTVAASMLDVDMVIGGGVGALSKVARATRLAVGLTANAAVLGVAAQGGTITPLDVIGTSVGVALSAIPGVRKVTRAAEQETVQAERAAATAAGGTADTVVPPANRTAAAVEVPTQEVKPTTVPDTDYPTIKLDTYSNKPHIEVGRTVSDAPEIVTDIRNAVNAVLTIGDDLPEGVRALGRALSSSLDADDAIPVVFRKTAKDVSGAPTERSFSALSADGSQQVNLLGAEPGTDLGSHIRNLSTYDKTIILHEAAHAKTQRTLQSIRNGTLTDGPAFEAAQRISEIRQYVAKTIGDSADKPKNYQVKYGLASDDEFIAQLFNSPEFRDSLSRVKMPGTTGSVFSDLVKRVVSLFTKGAPTGTAFDETLTAFEGLLQQPAATREVFLRQAVDTPKVQSAILQAPNVLDMNDKVMGALNRNFSLYERLRSFGAKADTLANQLVVDATGTSANSAAHFARAHHLASNVAIVQVDDALRQGLSAEWPLAQRLRHPVLYRDAQRDLSQKVYQQLAENHERHLKGQQILPNADPRVNSAVDAFVQSNWAQDQLARLRSSGIPGAADIPESPYYLPRQHSGNKLNDYMRTNTDVTRDDIVGMYTEQFKRMFAQNGIEDATARKLGSKMFDNMQDQAAHVRGYRQSIAGMPYDDIENTLEALGASDQTVKAFLDEVRISGTDQNKVRNLRHRAEFDMTATHTTKSGKLISPSMFVNNDVMGLMEGYSRRMAGRVGLAEAGFPDLRDAVKAIDEAAAEAQNPAEALHAFDNTMNQLLGYPTGEDVPDLLRSASIVGGALNLANSGIYQLADMSLMLQQFGIIKTMKAFGSTAFGRDAMSIAQSAEFGSRLRDVIEARHVLSGKYRSVLTHLEDNRDIGSLGVAHRYVQQMGQGTRFVNGMEFIRRGQSKLVAGLIADTVDDAIAGNAAAVTAMERFGLTQDLLNRLKTATTRNPDMRTWPDNVRAQIESVTHNMADAIVLENRLGEIPAWMQFSTVGKVVLPYMTFVAGAWNKILRRTARLDGATGVAMALAYQMPLVTLSSATSLFLGGKEVTPQSVAERAIVQVPMMSWAGFAVDFWANGASNNIAALALVDRMHAAMSGIANGDVKPDSVIKAVPFLSILPGMRLMGASLADDDE